MDGNHAPAHKRPACTEYLPLAGEKQVSEITARELLGVLNKTVERGRIDTATRVRAGVGRVFRYAVATGRAERDPTADLAGALPTAKTRHRATLVEPRQVGELLRAVDTYGGTFIVQAGTLGVFQAGGTGTSGMGGI